MTTKDKGSLEHEETMTDWPATPYLADNTLHVCDAIDLLRALPSQSVDLIATDPPYGINYQSSRSYKPNGKPRERANNFGKDNLSVRWLGEAARVLKSTGAIYLFSRWDTIHHFVEEAIVHGLSVGQRIIWDKLHWGMGDLRFFGSQTEDILFLHKGQHVLNWENRRGNIWRYPSKVIILSKDGDYNHPTQKPVDLMCQILRLSSCPDGLVVDPFVGSGTTAVAAKITGRRFICGDQSAEYIDIARKRVFPTFGQPPKRKREEQPITDLPLFAALADTDFA